MKYYLKKEMEKPKPLMQNFVRSAIIIFCTILTLQKAYSQPLKTKPDQSNQSVQSEKPKAPKIIDLDSSQIRLPGIQIMLETGSTWIGILETGNIYSAKRDLETLKAQWYKKGPIDDRDLVIIERFIRIRGLLSDKQKIDRLRKQQTRLLTNAEKQFPSGYTAKELQQLLKSTLILKIWLDGELTEFVLANTKEGQMDWPEDLIPLLKLITRLASEAPQIKTTTNLGIGFLQNLDNQKDDKYTWSKFLEAGGRKFKRIEKDDLINLNPRLQRMIEIPGFMSLISTEDLETMYELGWQDTEPPPILWWGLLEYQGEKYGINTWEIEK